MLGVSTLLLSATDSGAATPERDAVAPAAMEAPVASVATSVPSQPLQVAPVPPIPSATAAPIGSLWADTQPMAQVTSVSQLSDIQPTDWAFQALQSLVERYGCIAGYPDGTYRGQRAMTRFEFAAGLNACMDRVNELIASATADLVRKEDLLAIQKLQEEFSAELATLRGRVDALEARTAQLEAQGFSTTTKLSGEAVFAIAAASNWGGTDNQPVFQNRVRLELQTSFTGKDSLVTRLGAGNSPTFALPANPANPGVGSAESFLTFEGYGANDVIIDWLAYTFPVGEKATFYVAAVGGANTDYLPSAGNPVLDQGDGGLSTLSFFGTHNAIYNIGGGAGAGFNYQFNDTFQFSLGYLAGPSDAASPVKGAGLFNGDYAALAQLTINPIQDFTLLFTYLNSYHSPGTGIFNYGGYPSGVEGSSLANFPGGTGAAVTANSYGIEASYQFSPRFVLSAWGGFTEADIQGSGTKNGEIWNYALTFAFPDLLRKGNLGALIVGAQPYLGNPQQVGYAGASRQVPIHVEAYYQHRLNDYMTITPGLIYLSAPDQQSNGEALIGVIRTTFEF